MILKIKKNVKNNFSALKDNLKIEYGSSFLTIDKISDVEYEDFLMGYGKTELINLITKADYKIIDVAIENHNFSDSPYFCGKIVFNDKNGDRKLLVYDTCGYLCNDEGKTIASFPHQLLQDKETWDMLRKNKNHAKYLNSIVMSKTNNKNFEHIVKNYMRENNLKAEDMIGVAGFDKEWCDKNGNPKK